MIRPEPDDQVSALDPDALRTLRDELADDASLVAFLHCWCDLLPRRLGRINAALLHDDAAMTGDAALSLQVTSAMIGLTALSGAAGAVARHAARNEIDAARRAFVRAQMLSPDALRAVRAHVWVPPRETPTDPGLTP